MNENDEKYAAYPKRYWKHRHSGKGKVFGGIVLLAIGSVLLARQLGAQIPEWVFTWEMLLITIGFYIGAKHSFKHPGWLVPVMVGAVFLIDDIMPGTAIAPYIWPAVIIGAGLLMIFGSRKRCGNPNWQKWDRFRNERENQSLQNDTEPISETWQDKRRSENPEDYLETVAVFGGIKKNIVSKDFKGGDIVSFFGGTEINLSQADINGRVVLEITQVFGGTNLIVPAHWEIKSELVAVMSGIEDKRPLHNDLVTDSSKVLIIRGTAVFSALDIKSY